MARGSGIPEIKTILGGFTMPEVLEYHTLIIKIIGLGLSVGAGLSCGKEGPLVHIACCWCNVICNNTQRYSKNEGKKRELLSCACAAGVAVAFGAPLGGVLFSLEEASTYFPMKTMIKAFTGGAVAAWMLEVCHTDPKTGIGYLTMFTANYPVGPAIVEYLFFIIIGIGGGCIGAVFVHYNIIISKFRAPGSPWRKKVHIALEVGVISFLTAITSFPLLWTRVISNTTLRALFHNCANVPKTGVDPHTFMLDLCDPDAPAMPNLSMEVCWLLLASAALRYVQMTFTFGCGAPSGLFIPSLYAGAAMGRVFGICVWIFNSTCEGGCIAPTVYPGVYSMMGAAAVLGGVCRVTISLVVIMFELTSGLQLIVPFMIVCLLAKYTGDYFTPGIYDYCITIRKYPFLHEPDDVMYHSSAADLIDEDLEMITPDCGTVVSFRSFLGKARFGGYPVVQSLEDPVFLGYLFTEDAKDYLNAQCKNNVMINTATRCVMGRYMTDVPVGVFDITADPEMNFVDDNIVAVSMETPAALVHKIFRQLGNKIIIVKREGHLAGLITKKSFIRHMEQQHSAADHPEEAVKAKPEKKNRRASCLKAAS
jgi:chloride channel 3/4/5